MSKLTKALTAAAGNAGGDPLYVEDVFSTYLYTGNSSTQTITNGIDLAGEGGLVWAKTRSASGWNHGLTDTERGLKELQTNNTTAESSFSDISSFNSDGFSLTYLTGSANKSPYDIASWTFRKAEKFFDIVTYTGDGVDNRQIPHNLGSVPGMIIVKSTSSAGQWPVYHQSLGTGAVRLNLTNSYNSANIWWKTTPTDSHFTVYGGGEVNVSGIEYVAYLFASDAGGYGDDGSESIIKCGSYVGSSDTAPYVVSVDLGFEPQWLLVKNVTTGGAGKNWILVDTMRGFHATGADKELRPNTSDAENDSSAFNVTSTGFSSGSGGEPNIQGNTYIYIAIRRPMKTPESGTEVFNPFIYTGNNVGGRELGSLSGADSILAASRNTSDSIYPNWQSKLQGNSTRLVTSDTGAEYTSPSYCYSFGNIQNGVTVSGSDMNGSGKTYVAYEFKRATGFFDVVTYTGNGTASRQITHNLGAAPELLIVKGRSTSNDWQTWHKALPDDGAWASNVFLNSTDSYGGFQRFDGAATQTAAYWTTGNNGEPNTSSQTYIAYLFATLAGVSKVGSYTGDGTTDGSNVIDCGFSAGARFVLIKRTDSTGSWLYMDSVRGITSSNDPILKLNSGGTEQLGNSVHPAASGFGVVEAGGSNANTNGANYIFLAIA